jgi:hypothetical protein
MINIFDSKVIILANSLGGTKEYVSRWNNHLGLSKHMVPIGGIPLIHYLQKQLKHYGFKDIHISCQKEDSKSYIIDNNTWINPPDTSTELAPNNEIIICKDLFSKEKNNIILFGDNFYSNNFFKIILAASTNKVWLYGRPNASSYVNKKYGEPFGWSVPFAQVDFIINCAEEAIAEMWKYDKECTRDSGIKRTYSNVIKKQGIFNFLNNYLDITDETTDFDYPEEWDFWSINVLPNITLNDFKSE